MKLANTSTKNIIFLNLCLSIIIVVGFQSCFSSITFVDVAKVRTELIDGIESYQSPDDFKKILNNKVYLWEITEDSGNGYEDKWRPPFNVYTIKITNYSYLGFSGELRISFLNKRLRSTIFYPSDINMFKEKLLEENTLNFNGKQEIRIPPFTLVRVDNDYIYIKWSDIRLDKETKIWIDKYA